MEEKENKQMRRMKSIELFNRTTKSFLISKKDDLKDLDSMKITEIFKNPYSVKAGRSINNLRLVNQELRNKVHPKIERVHSMENFDFMKDAVKTKKTFYKSGFFKKTHSSNDLGQGFGNTKTENIDELKAKNIHYNPILSQNFMNSTFSSNLNPQTQTRFNNNTFYSLKPKYTMKDLLDTKKRNNVQVFPSVKKGFYCPHCSHCTGKMKDDTLEEHIISIQETKNILENTFDYILRSNFFKKSSLNFFAVKTKEKDDIESMLNNFPKPVYKKSLTFKTIAYCLDGLLEDKFSLNELLSVEIVDKFRECLLSKGDSYGLKSQEAFFDKELITLMDEKTKESSIAINQNNNIENQIELNPDKEYDEMIKANKKRIGVLLTNIQITEKTKEQKEKEKKSEEELERLNLKKKHFFMFLTLMQLLGEINKESKEKSFLIYKLFKLYFVEIEKKWADEFKKNNERVEYYKNFCKRILMMTNTEGKRSVDEVNNILLKMKVTEQNLQDHKSIIQELLSSLNKKKNQIYTLESKIDIMKNELSFWVWDFEHIKHDLKLRERIKNVPVYKIQQNVESELAGKNLDRSEKACLINSDRFILSTQQRNYFFEQKTALQDEIEKLNKLRTEQQDYIARLHQSFSEFKNESDLTINRLTKQIEYFRNFEKTFKHADTQTDIDFLTMNNMSMNHDSVIFIKSLNKNKLSKFIERIRFNVIKPKEISRIQIMSLIPEIYNEKYISDTRRENLGLRKFNMDEFFYDHIEKIYKLKELVNEALENTINSILIYSKNDERINVFRKFLGIGDSIYRREVLDLFLSTMKALPQSFYKLFADDYKSLVMKSENCFDILFNKLAEFKLVTQLKKQIFNNTKVYDDGKLNTSLSKESSSVKEELLILMRFYSESYIFIKKIDYSFEREQQRYMPIDDFYEYVIEANKDFELDKTQIKRIFDKYFEPIDDMISLESFRNFFHSNRLTFEIRIESFITIVLEKLHWIFETLEKEIKTYYDMADIKEQGMIFFKDFESMMNLLLTGNENVWKIVDYFKIAKGSDIKIFVTKEEFISFCLNTKDMIFLFLSKMFIKHGIEPSLLQDKGS